MWFALKVPLSPGQGDKVTTNVRENDLLFRLVTVERKTFLGDKKAIALPVPQPGHRKFPVYPLKPDIPRGGQNVRFVHQRLRKPPTMSARTSLLLLRRPGPCWLEGRAILKSERHERNLSGQTKSGTAPRRRARWAHRVDRSLTCDARSPKPKSEVRLLSGPP